MARVSTKQNKNRYHTTRESLQLTREEASELLEAITPERIEKIENERTLPHPDEVLLMAEKYTPPESNTMPPPESWRVSKLTCAGMNRSCLLCGAVSTATMRF